MLAWPRFTVALPRILLKIASGFRTKVQNGRVAWVWACCKRVHGFELLLCLQVDAYEGPWYSMIRLDVGDGEKRRRWFGGVFDGLQGLMI